MPLTLTVTGASFRRAVIAVATLAVAVAAGIGVASLIRTEDPFAWFVDEDRYQAVILSNGKVYIGHVRAAPGDYVELRDAWFLRSTGSGPPQVEPLHLELHGPENRMLIGEDDVVQIENLADDSPVHAAIAQRAQ